MQKKLKTKKHVKAHTEIKHRWKSKKIEVVKLHIEEGKISSAISAKSFEDKEVQENAQRSKTQVEIEKIEVVNDTETVKIEDKLVEVETNNGKTMTQLQV